MKYYIIQKGQQPGVNDFEIVKVDDCKFEEFEKQYAGQFVIVVGNFINLIAAFEKKLSVVGIRSICFKAAFTPQFQFTLAYHSKS